MPATPLRPMSDKELRDLAPAVVPSASPARRPQTPLSQLPDDAADPSQVLADSLDRSIRFAVSRATNGLSPAAVAEAYLDWLTHLAASPGKLMQISHKAFRKGMRFNTYMMTCLLNAGRDGVCIEPLADDKRFADTAWHNWPFNVFHQQFLLQQQWWHVATTDVRGMTRQHERQVQFATRQLLDVFAPSNFLWSNPVVQARTRQEAGLNLLRGWRNFVEDSERVLGGRPPAGTEAFTVGEKVAATPGTVVFRNDLIELIQYEPTTETVRPEPIVIVPAWIMKYYILDLTETDSLIRFLVAEGFTVFTISWRNPGPELRDTSLEDYRRRGIEPAIAAARHITGARKVHGLGYCLGGTLLSIAAAAYARNGDDPFASLTLFAAQIDFQDAGELTLFLSESQISFLEDMMWEQGYLAAQQMAGAFQMLRSNDLIWSRVVHEYLMGERPPMTAMMAWNADATRMPARMHSDYLRGLFLRNDLAEGRYQVDGRAIALTDIRAPVFAVGADKDHVAPWRSVYKLQLFLDADVTFLLAKGGHNNGIISPPGGHPSAGYRVATKREGDLYVDADAWLAREPVVAGSWWPALASWLAQRSGEPHTPPRIGAPEKGYAPLCAAPGTYVHER